MRFAPACLCSVLSIAAFAQSSPLAGTAPLTQTGDLAAAMVDGLHTWLDRQLERSPAERERRWLRDFSSPAAYARSVEANRARLRKVIGAVDVRVPFQTLTAQAAWPPPRRSEPASPSGVRAELVRWPVLPGVEGEGVLLIPPEAPVARIVALPDADWAPEYIAGLERNAPLQHQFARRLAESGCLVLVPTLIDRRDTWSGNRDIRFTNQPHREYIYRMAYEMGRHIIGYEVQKVLAAVDFFALQPDAAPIGVAGYGEGGLIALHAAALDTRIDTALVSGYFAPREQQVWREPIYRNVWKGVEEFGDAEIASLILPRGLVVEAAHHPEIAGPPLEREGRRGAAPGRIATPAVNAVEREFARAQAWYEKGGAPRKCVLVKSGDGLDEPGSEAALARFLELLGVATAPAPASTNAPVARALAAEQNERMRRQFGQLVDYTQALVRRSDIERSRFLAKSDAPALRRYFEEEVIGKLNAPQPVALNARTRQTWDTPAFRGYEVYLPVLDEVFAYGALLVPKDLKPGERRPVVVCQHGLEGRPEDLIDPKTPKARDTYQRFAAALAERGFVVYAPQNPYIFGERFRSLLRKSHPLKLTLFSFITAQHRRTLDFLSALPFVDPERIGFYGLSYGGKTAMRVPPLDPRYAAVICSGDFNEWVWKITSVDQPFSYMFTHEYDMLEFDLGNTFNYAELAALIAPRPFMVERGRNDGVGSDERIAYEFAKVKRAYDKAGRGADAELEFFAGPHQIHGVGTYDFLHRHLKWPVR